MLQWPGQVVIAGCQTHWTREVSEALIENKIDERHKILMAQVSAFYSCDYKTFFFLIYVASFPYAVIGIYDHLRECLRCLGLQAIYDRKVRRQ